jgi:regulator of protease activity HflC (stomatin/prohibitin superfamily)
VSLVAVKDIDLPQDMQRAMAKQAEAERERRAKVIHAEGEFQASQKLSDAAEILSKQPASFHLRFLQALSQVAIETKSYDYRSRPGGFAGTVPNSHDTGVVSE